MLSGDEFCAQNLQTLAFTGFSCKRLHIVFFEENWYNFVITQNMYAMVHYLCSIKETNSLVSYRQQTTNKSLFAPPDRQLKRKLLISYSIFLLIIILLGIILYYLTVNNMRSNLKLQEQAVLNSSVQNMDTALRVADAFSRQLLMESAFLDVASYQSSSLTGYAAKAQSLRTYLAANLYPDMLLPLQNYYIYLPKSEYIVSPYHNTSVSAYYHTIQKYNNNAYELWVGQLNDPSCYGTFLPMNVYTSADDPIENASVGSYSSDRRGYLYLTELTSIFHSASRGVLALIFDEKKLVDYFPYISYYEGGYLFALDEEGNIMFTLSEQELFGGETAVRIESDVLSKTAADLYQQDFYNGYTRLSMNGIPMQVTRASSDFNGWTYYLMRPESTIYRQIYPYNYIYLGILTVTLLAGICVVRTLSRRNVQPLIELGTELELVNEERNQLQATADKQKPIVMTSYLRQLLDGTVSSEDEMAYIREYLELPGVTAAYNVVYVVAYNNLEGGSESGAAVSDTEDFNSLILDSLKQYFGVPLHYYSPEERTYAVLIADSTGNADGLFMQAQETIVKLHDYLLDNYGIWLFAGIGQAAESLMNVWECYQQATEAASYSAKNYIFFPYEIIEKKSNAFYYPPELSTKLIHFITTGSKTQVLELFSLIHHENIEERSLPSNLLQYLMQDIRNTLLKARFSLPADTDEERLRILDEQFNEHLSFKLCEDLALSLCDLFQREQKDQSLAATIEKYIKSNYRDPSLGLNKISDEFQISETYFSHMFKEKTGVNFSVYLEALRMREAARLIQDTKLNLSELYIEVGYNNPATFRRAFKKIYGVTPSAMRENASRH